MSPVGGVGINYAIQDAVVAANLLAGPLRAGTAATPRTSPGPAPADWPTVIIQTVQAMIQKRFLGAALDASRPFRPPAFPPPSLPPGISWSA